ncbi:MAG: hypothetical protein ABIT08_04260 [Bacteroidia bacterium]
MCPGNEIGAFASILSVKISNSGIFSSITNSKMAMAKTASLKSITPSN